MKLKEITLDEELILTSEIAYLIGTMGHMSKDNIHDRIKGIIDIIDNDGMAVFAEFCKFVAYNFMNSTLDKGIEEFVASYSSELLDEFIDRKITMTKDEELTLINNRVINLVYPILLIQDSGREVILNSILSNYYQVFKEVTQDYEKNIVDLAKALIYMFDSRNELFDGCYGGDMVWKEGIKDRLEDLTAEYFLGVE